FAPPRVTAVWSKEGGRDVLPFLAVWVATAAVSVALAAFETIVRSRRVHSGFAAEMIQSAVEQFLPATIVGLLLTGVMLVVAPEGVWMLPGLLEVILSLGV